MQFVKKGASVIMTAIKVKNIKYIVLALFICLFSTSESWVVMFIPSFARNLIAILLLSLEAFLLVKDEKIDIKLVPLLCLLLFMVLVTIRNSAWGPYRTLIFWSAMLLSVYAAKWNGIYPYLFRFSLIMYAFYAFWTIFLFFNRDFYMRHIVGLFPETKDRLINWYNQGCMAGLTPHYSTNAMLLVTGVIMMALIYVEYRNKKNLFFLLFLLVALLLTGKRAHIVFSAAALYGTYYFSLVKENPFKKLFKMIGLVLALVLVVVIGIQFVPALANGITRILQLFDSGSGADDDNAVMARFELWALAIRAFKAHPIFGIGWKQFRDTISVTRNSQYAFDTHNVYLQLLCETGIIGFVIYLAWFLFMFFKTMSLYRHMIAKVKGPTRIHLNFALTYQIFFLMYCCTGNPLYDYLTSIPYFFACGIILYYDRHRCQDIFAIKARSV